MQMLHALEEYNYLEVVRTVQPLVHLSPLSLQKLFSFLMPARPCRHYTVLC